MTSRSNQRDDVLRLLEENLDEIRGFGVRRLGLFGSSARNAATESSDLDFVVEFERKSFDAYMELKFFLEELFSCRVDLVIASAIKPGLKEIIQRETVYAQGL